MTLCIALCSSSKMEFLNWLFLLIIWLTVLAQRIRFSWIVSHDGKYFSSPPQNTYFGMPWQGKTSRAFKGTKWGRRRRLSDVFVLFLLLPFFVSSCWPTRDHIGSSNRNSNPVMTSSTGPVPRVVQTTGSVHATPTYTAQLLALHQHRANNQYRTANQI